MEILLVDEEKYKSLAVGGILILDGQWQGDGEGEGCDSLEGVTRCRHLRW